ncbi:MarR family transcriptional regulator [Mycolicibacterium sp. P1-18]|nr:MarR family transcriptional regulator [Mycolicibacterium sp. P1-18]
MDVATDLLIRHLADRSGLSAAAAMLLNRLAQEGPARLTTLAWLEGTSQPAMTQMIQRLERQGLVERCGDPDDGRAAIVSLAPDARVRLDDRTVARRARLADLMDTLSSEDEFSLALAAQVALPILRRLSENAAVASARRRTADEARCVEQGDGEAQG